MKAERLFSEHKYADAVVEYKRTLDADPNYSYALFAIGDCYTALKDMAQAKFYYEKYIGQYPGKPDAYFALAEQSTPNLFYFRLLKLKYATTTSIP